MYRQLIDWLTGASTASESRLASRVFEPKVVVFYWDGSVPAGHRLRDVSPTGAYLYTSERWYPGTIIRLLLQEEHVAAIGGDTTVGDTTVGTRASASIPARVVRHGPDGVAVEFLFRSLEDRQLLDKLITSMNGQALPRPVSLASKKQARRGQALVEFALIVPLLFLLIVNAVNFGGFLFAWITIASAARAGGEYWALGSVAVATPTPTPATAAQVTTLVTNDIASLLGRSSLVVRVCKNNNSVVTCTGAGSLAPPADPEPSTYILTTVDVTYTWQPPIPLWDFGGLGIHATLPPTSIHRRAVMRMLQ